MRVFLCLSIIFSRLFEDQSHNFNYHFFINVFYINNLFYKQF